MNRVDQTTPDCAIVAAIDSAPAWTKLALSMRDPAMRERGIRELARSISDSLNGVSESDAHTQLSLL